MGEQRSPRITRYDVKLHLRYVWGKRKAKARRIVAAKKKQGKEFVRSRIDRHVPVKIVFTKDREKYRDWLFKELGRPPTESWISAQDLFLPNIVGRENPGFSIGVLNTETGVEGITPAERGDEKLPDPHPSADLHCRS